MGVLVRVFRSVLMVENGVFRGGKVLIAGTVVTEQKHNNSGCKLCFFVGWFILKHAGNLLVFWCGFFGPFCWGKMGYLGVVTQE